MPLPDCILLRTVLPSGYEFHYVESGTGPSLVFVHGGAGDYTTWSPQWDFFTPRFRCLSYSRRYNQPNRNVVVADHSALGEAEDLEGLIGAWGATPAVLVAASYGAFTALALAIRRPELVRAMVLIEPPLMAWAHATERGRRLWAEFQQNVREPVRQAFLRGDDEMAARLLTMGVTGQRDISKDDGYMSVRRRNMQAMKVLSLSSDEFPLLPEEDVGAIRVPTLLVTGENTEPLLEEVFRVLAMRMPHAENTLVRDAGHAVAREQPDRFNEVAGAFLDRLGHD